MDYRVLPNTNLKVSSICLGTMTWGQQNTEAEAHDQLDYAIEHGVNFLDTAEVYPVPPEKEKQGRTETYIGDWLAKRRNRNSLIIASKVAGPSQTIRLRPTPENGRTRLDRANILAAIDGTLERLQTDYIDIYQVHWPERQTNFFGIRGFEGPLQEDDVPLEETLSALHEVLKSGKAKYIGVSNETPWGVGEYVRLSRESGLPRIISIQNQYSLINRTYEIGLSELCMREKVSLIAYSPLSMGVLSGKYLNGAQPAGARFTLWDRNKARYNPPHAQSSIQRYVDIAAKYALDPSQMAIAFVNSRHFVASTIIGATTLPQLESDIAAADMKLSHEVFGEIQLAYKELPDPTA